MSFILTLCMMKAEVAIEYHDYNCKLIIKDNRGFASKSIYFLRSGLDEVIQMLQKSTLR